MNREMMKSTAIGRNQLAQAMITPERMSVYTLFLLNRIYSESKAKNIMGISLSNVVDCPQLLGYRIYIKSVAMAILSLLIYWAILAISHAVRALHIHIKTSIGQKLPNNQSENTIRLMEPMFHIQGVLLIRVLHGYASP